MKRNLFFTGLIIVLFGINSNGQCLSEGGDGSFDVTSIYNQWVKMPGSGGVDYGSFSHETTEPYIGEGSMKAEVTQTAPWQMRMVSSVNCPQTVVVGADYKVNFWLKGPAAGDVKVTLDYSSGTDLMQTIEATTDWTEYSVVFTPTVASTDLRIKIGFVDVGTYYIDEVTFGAATIDCNGDADGTAAVDDCGICAGGNTGIVSNSFCPATQITPDNANIRYDGVLYKNVTNTYAELYRFTQGYVASDVYEPLDQFYGPHQAKGSRTQSGISLVFKTNSTFMYMHFETLVHSLDLGIRFTVFKDGELYLDNISDPDFVITNDQATLSEYEVYFPSLHGLKFLGMDIDEASTLSALPVDTRPTYVAVGNSITHGVGQDNASHLTYPFLVGKQLDYHVYNLGISGSRINKEVITNLAGLPNGPDVLTILWGYNNLKDAIALSEQMIEFQTLMNQLLLNYPNTKVYALLQSYTRTEAIDDNTVAELRILQQDILTDLQSQYTNLKVIDAWDYTDDTGLNDAVHLNEHGAQTLADGIVSEILADEPTTLLKEKIINAELKIIYNKGSKSITMVEIGKYEIFSMNDEIVSEGISDGTISVEGLLSGVYVLRINKKTGKFIVR
ncbi:hypothetical protein E9993_16630 [Labilibacter sediminis]|nr:hypothetical protein E9993_16630 [Labilibacter sediminis]